MEINFSLLETYFIKNNNPATINIDIESGEPILILINGKNREGSRREFLNPNDMMDILVVNNIVGENSLVSKELDTMSFELNSGLGNRNNREKKVEELIYGTLAKYIIQMLISNTGKVWYPEIKPLEKHKRQYFTTKE